MKMASVCGWLIIIITNIRILLRRVVFMANRWIFWLLWAKPVESSWPKWYVPSLNRIRRHNHAYARKHYSGSIAPPVDGRTSELAGCKLWAPTYRLQLKWSKLCKPFSRRDAYASNVFHTAFISIQWGTDECKRMHVPQYILDFGGTEASALVVTRSLTWSTAD